MGDADFPHLGATADVHRRGTAPHPAVAHAFDVVGVDFQAHAGLLGAVDAQRSGNAAQRFGQGYGRAAVQQAHGLVGAPVYGHAPFKGIVGHRGDFDAQGMSQIGARVRPALHFFQGHLLLIVNN